MAKFNKGDKVVYIASIPYILSNGQQVNKEGDSITLISDVNVSDGYFKLYEPEIDIDAVHGEALKENEVFDEKKAEEVKKEELAKKVEEAKNKATKADKK